MSETGVIDLNISQEERKEICEEFCKAGSSNNTVELDGYNLRNTMQRKKPSGAAVRRNKSLKKAEASGSIGTKRPLSSPEANGQEASVKRHKEEGKSFSDILKAIDVIVKPVNYPESLIDEGGVIALEKHLLRKIDMLKVGESAPQFHQRKLVDGYWRIKCIGQETKDWLKKAVENVRLKGFFLEMIDAADLEVRPKCRVFLPGECSMDLIIMHRFRVQNPEFDFSSWRIVSNKRQFNNDGRNVVIEMVESSVNDLKGKKCYLAYGLTQVKFHEMEKSGGKLANTDPISSEKETGQPMECDQKEEGEQSS